MTGENMQEFLFIGGDGPFIEQYRTLTPPPPPPRDNIGVRSRRGCTPGFFFKLPFFGQKKKQVKFAGQNHLIFGQALEKKFGQETSAPPPPPTKPVPYAHAPDE